MQVSSWLISAGKQLALANIGTGRLDAQVLLEDVTGKDRAWLLAHPEFEVHAAQQRKLESLLKRRAEHEPLAYIRGRAEFYGREFVLTPAVLQPRSESETMIDMFKKVIQPGTALKIADVGAGSGALGITAQLELTKASVELLEIDPKAIKIAKINVDNFTLAIPVIKSDLLASSSHDYDVLLCNLPYVPDDYNINLSAGHEPKLAIFGGSDGLDIYRRLFQHVQKLNKQPLYILCECLPFQQNALVSIAALSNYRLQQTEDFILLFNSIS